MQVIDELIQNQSAAFSKRFEDLVITRLNELGYSTVDRMDIAKRCTTVMKENSKDRELWIDYEKASQRLIALYTDPVSRLIESKGVYTGKIEFKFTPVAVPNHGVV